MADQVVGRQAEERAVADFLDVVPRQPSALVIEGEPGIGKTTLWLDALDQGRARGFRTLSCRAAAAESVLAYTVLADLFAEVDDAVWADLPTPQRRALDGALLRHRGEAPEVDPRAVAAAFVTVIGRLAAEKAVVIAIDDLQWVDTSSANAVSYAARRLPAAAALVCTTRTGEAAARLQLPSPDAVRRIRLQPLTVGEMHQVLSRRMGRSVARPALLRIHEIAGGNPFFALELSRELGAEGRPSGLSLPSSLNDLVRSRVDRVGADDVLLAMASLPDPTVPVVARAIDSTPEQVVQSLGAAEAQAVVAIDGNQLRFTHPILAHGVYSAAPPRRRREMHRRLAQLVTEPELRARHLALADTSGQPETIAAIDTAADIARARGAPAAAAELLELAFSLGANDPGRRIRCATYYFDAGDAARARQILAPLVAALPSGPDRARALHQLGLVRLYEDSFLESAELLEAAVRDSGTDAGLRARILISLSFALLNAGRSQQAYERVQQAVAEGERLGFDDLISSALGMRAVMDFMGGKGFDESAARRAVEMEDRSARVPLAFRPHVQMTLLRAWTGELELARNELADQGQQCLAVGEEGELIFVAFHLALVDIWLGRLEDAAITANATTERAAQMGGDFPLFIARTLRAAVAAYAGRLDDARSDVVEAIEAGQRCGSTRLAEWPATLAGFIEVSDGDYSAALGALEPLLPMVQALPELSEIISSSFVPDAVEAMVGLGRLEDAEPLVTALERNGRRLDRAWTLAVGMRCRAMLQAARGDVTAAVATAESAVAEHQRLPMPFERARTQLLLGQLLRRQRRRDAAAATLQEAAQTFQRLGTAAWAKRAETELARGVSGRRREQGLTAAEERVAELAASGMINRDVATALFVSPKTVEVTLSRVYRKLNIRSRAELYQALQAWKSETDMSR
ncbi:AAA family ATPase [Mycobacterium terramassiliense]|uniref:ATP-, maltotriose-and DNA-dependent transcriptional regulator MalT n=1 Tax=Mycobacterium terramassiliense TaxID=1841859 RepID=A0A2U3N5A4_9MYCO|nr:LuxR family transcriptional regulator [Mycobacterium terramassiliense]SPM26691.1 ATP-, maltotriose-and DNA-dependent transcriptional regulator MalT [Mycobacterium terramassiliense]